MPPVLWSGNARQHICEGTAIRKVISILILLLGISLSGIGSAESDHAGLRLADPDVLEALRADPAIRLNIAAVTVPERIVQAAAALPDQVRLLGFLPHSVALALQRRAHVLVNIANEDHTQVPGKIYEYLGSGRPILHLGNGNDPTAALVEQLRRGWICRNQPDALATLLATLASARAHGTLEQGLCLKPHAVQQYSWQHIARQLDSLLRETARKRG